MTRSLWSVVAVLSASWVLAPATAQAGKSERAPASDAPDQTPSEFVRFVKVGDGGHLDTAITTYKKGDVEVTFFGAVHIADASHYAALQQRFRQCDALLYELVGPKDFRPKPGQKRGSSAISLLQTAMKNALELQFQLDAIDYTPDNFVHADLDGEEFRKQMEARGESLLSLMWNSMMNAMQRLREGGGEKLRALQGVDLVQAFKQGEGRHQLRLMLAAQLEGIEEMAAGFGKDGQGTTLVEGRNTRCLEVLQQQVAAGRKKLGIYYGAAHFRDMEQRLVGQLGFHKVGHEWLLAWDCTKRPDPKFDHATFQKRLQAKDELVAIATAARAWRSAHGELPTMAQLTRSVDGVAPYTGSKQDPWGQDYVLREGDRADVGEVASAGQDGQLGTNDDIVVTVWGSLVKTPLLSAQLAKARTDLREIERAVNMYMLTVRTNEIPKLDDLVKPAKGDPLLQGDTHDPWGKPYVIRNGKERGEFTVHSAGPDGVFDTADDLVVGDQ